MYHHLLKLANINTDESFKSYLIAKRKSVPYTTLRDKIMNETLKGWKSKPKGTDDFIYE